MSDDELNDILNNLTKDIIDTYNIEIPIRNIDDVVATLGGCVKENSNICSSCIKRQNDGFVIYIPSSYSAEREQFAIAQELGHLFLHMGYKISKKLWGKQKKYGLL